MFITKYKLKILIRDTVEEEITRVTDGYKREEVYVSEDKISRYLHRWINESLQTRINDVVGKESFIDEVIARIQKKQL
jgi:hypothetical protein